MEKDKTNSGKPQDTEEIVDLEQYASSGKKPPEGKKYNVRIDDEKFIFDHQFVTGKELLETAGKIPPECYSLYQKLKHGDFQKIDCDSTVDLALPGIERFVVKPPEVFYYTVDNEPKTTDLHSLTPNQILELAGILPVTDYYIVLINPDGSQVSYKDKPEEMIPMKCPGLKFVSLFKGETPVS